jgi:hypothetical protein
MYIMEINICKGEDLIPHKYYISSEKTLVDTRENSFLKNG